MQEKYDLIIKNGRLVTPAESGEKDIAVKDGKIAAIGEKGSFDSADGTEIYDAAGKVVIPGLIEPHMHIKAPLGGFTDVLDFDSASDIAAFGGVTTFIDFTSTLPGMKLKDAFRERRDEMKKATLDYSLHMKIVNLVKPELTSALDVMERKYARTGNAEDLKYVNILKKSVNSAIDGILAEIPQIIKEEGIPTFKLFMTYRKAGVMIDDTYMLKVMECVRDNGGRCGFHAESNAIAEYNEEVFEKEGKLDWEYFPEYKSGLCEAEAVARVLHYAEMLKAPVYFFHISAAESVELIRVAQKRGVDVLAETCSHYLNLDKSYNKGDDGILYLMSPPLRRKEDQNALWQALKDGVLSLVSSDNCTFTRKQKESPLKKGERDFRKPISGVSGLEERFTLMRKAVDDGKISENDFVRLLCENPAKLFGLYPRKGVIQSGSDADITIFDPNKVKTLTRENLHYPDSVEYSIYSEFSGKGLVETVIRRGEFLIKDGELNRGASKGLFIKRSIIRKP